MSLKMFNRNHYALYGMDKNISIKDVRLSIDNFSSPFRMELLKN